MAISINPLTYVVSIPQSDLTHVSGTLYTLDTNWFRLQLKAWEDDVYGMPHPKTHDHYTEVTVAGVTYSRFIIMLAPYTVEFEDGQYTVQLAGSNNNIWSVQDGILVQNQVQVIPGNSAGLITVTSGSGLDASQDAKLTRLYSLFDEVETGYDAQDVLKLLAAVLAGKVSVSGDTFTFRDLNDTTDRVTATATQEGERTSVNHNV